MIQMPTWHQQQLDLTQVGEYTILENFSGRAIFKEDMEEANLIGESSSI